MTRALVTQMLNALEHHQSQTRPIHKTEFAITAAREYLATEPSGERAELIAQLRDAHGRRFDTSPSPYSQAADMLEAEVQQVVEPYGWMVKGVPTVMRGSLAKEIQEQEAEHIGGDCYAYPVYLHPPQPQATYSDSTPLLHVGNSSFEDWFQERDRAGKSDKQLAREAYAAGMGDPLVTYAAAQGEKK